MGSHDCTQNESLAEIEKRLEEAESDLIALGAVLKSDSKSVNDAISRLNASINQNKLAIKKHIKRELLYLTVAKWTAKVITVIAAIVGFIVGLAQLLSMIR